MKGSRLAAAVLLLYGLPAAAEFAPELGLRSFKAPDAGVPDLGPGAAQTPADPAARLAATLADAGTPMSAKAMALAGMDSDAFRAIDSARLSLTPSEEGVMVDSLRALAEGGGLDDGTRLRAVRVLGAFGRSLRTEAAVDAAVDELVSLARTDTPGGRDPAFRRAALYGLAQTAQAMPEGDRHAVGATLNAAYDALRGSDAVDKQSAMTLIAQDAARNGAASYDADPALMRRLRGELLAPLENRIDALYDDASMNPGARLALYTTLYRLARSLTLDANLRFEAAQLLRAAAQSQREREPQLQALLDLYTTGRWVR